MIELKIRGVKKYSNKIINNIKRRKRLLDISISSLSGIADMIIQLNSTNGYPSNTYRICLKPSSATQAKNNYRTLIQKNQIPKSVGLISRPPFNPEEHADSRKESVKAFDSSCHWGEGREMHREQESRPSKRMVNVCLLLKPPRFTL